MNLGTFWETYLGLLKILFHKFSHNIAKFSHLTFIFDVLSESRIGFFSFLVYLALRNVISSIKTRVCPERSSVSWICGNVSRQHWPQFGITYWQDICLIGKEIVLENATSPTSCSYIFLNLLLFLSQLHYC